MLSELKPLKGFKWENDWNLIVESSVTDKEGY